MAATTVDSLADSMAAPKVVHLADLLVVCLADNSAETKDAKQVAPSVDLKVVMSVVRLVGRSVDSTEQI